MPMPTLPFPLITNLSLEPKTVEEAILKEPSVASTPIVQLLVAVPPEVKRMEESAFVLKRDKRVRGVVVPMPTLPLACTTKCVVVAEAVEEAMANKVVVILASGDPRVLRSGLEYAYNAISKNWLEDVKVFIFGPSEETILNDPDCIERANDIAALKKDLVACKWLSDNEMISDKLIEAGIKVEPVGIQISEAIKDGYIPITW